MSARDLITNFTQQRTYNLNFGPQHPARHGVLRLLLTLSGERVRRADPHIGLLHRGTEKLMEYKTLIQGLPYLDRLDYVSRIANEHVFVLTAERFFSVEVAEHVQYLRVLFLELTRLLNHLIALTTHRMDVGRLTPFLWAFEEREKIRGFYEAVSGARRHANWRSIGGVGTWPTRWLLEERWEFVNVFPSRLDEREDLLVSGRVWRQRTQHVGILTFGEAVAAGASGPRLRSTGCCWDLRKVYPYEVYQELRFGVPVGAAGDCFDRFRLRVYERRESAVLIQQCLVKLGLVDKIGRLRADERVRRKIDIEELITHFKTYAGYKYFGVCGELFMAAEAPKGEFGVFMVLDGGVRPYRVGFKAPGLLHLFLTNMLGVNHRLADIVTLIGTEDVVFGEVDR